MSQFFFIISGIIAYFIAPNFVPTLLVIFPVILGPAFAYIFQLKITREEKRLTEKIKAYEKVMQSLNEIIHKGLYKEDYNKYLKDIEKQLNDAYASIVLYAPDAIIRKINEIFTPTTETSTKKTLEEKLNEIRLILKKDLNERTTLTPENIKYLKMETVKS